jgi:sec-independent protein translocase protein TatB
MQVFGIGLPELLLILILAVIVVGPDRLPEVAAQLARWIRQLRSYAQYVARDFRDVVTEIERETGASREDLREIAGVLRRDMGRVSDELESASRAAERATREAGAAAEERAAPALPAASAADLPASNGASAEAMPPVEGQGVADAPPAAGVEEWYVPGRRRRRPQA